MDIVKYVFCPGSIPGLEEEITIYSSSHALAVNEVKKHIMRSKLSKGVIKKGKVYNIKIKCDSCMKVFENQEFIDCEGNKDKTFKDLVKLALSKDNKYRVFKKIHSHHSFNAFGEFVADGGEKYELYNSR